jgi:hypothetical protein
VSGSMRTLAGARDFAAIRSYTATATRHGCSMLDAPRARLTIDALWTPVRVSRSKASRSSMVKVTGYLLSEPTTTSCPAGGREELPELNWPHSTQD